MGDFGTLFPLAIGYIAFCGFIPAVFFVMMGLANIANGLLKGLSMPFVQLWNTISPVSFKS
ncbi:MAG: hypothetical protein JW743_04750 [Deltaproteobacteria bacterium]|nr:hypothetical protein [Deltaproteobacteria bacterium]MBN2846337.1 hypothetical protein [Deltaproteobacteria bacterium]